MDFAYVLHPQERFLPGINAWTHDLRSLLAADSEWANCRLIAIPHDDTNGFSANDLFSRIAGALGPVIIVEQVQTAPRENLRRLLRSRTIVSVADCIQGPEDLWQELETARKRFQSGEPFLPRKFVVAVLILRKLIHGDYWGGGAKYKAYAYVDNLAKGRGVDDQFSDVTSEVANDLINKGMLLKKPSNRRKKCALNPERRGEIIEAATSHTFRDEPLERLLLRDKQEVSARLLDE